MDSAARTPRAVQVPVALAMAIGGLGFLGWLLGIKVLASVVPGWVSMRPNTALGVILLGASLWLAQRRAGGNEGAAALRARQACALVAAMLGLLTISEYVLSVNLGVDWLMFHEAARLPPFPFPARMAPTSAVSFALLGVAVLALDAKAPATRWLVELPAILAGFVATLVLVGYLYDVRPIEGGSRIVRMAVSTALAFLALSAGVLASRPDARLMRILMSGPPGGVITRRVLPVVLGIILVLGWLGVRAEHAGLYSGDFGNAVQALAAIVLLTSLLLWSAALLNRAEAAARQVEAQYRSLVEHAVHGIYRSTLDGWLVAVNPALVEMLGYASADDLLAQHMSRNLYVDPEERGRLIAQYDGAERIDGVEVTWKRKDGMPVQARLSGRPVRGADGSVEGFEMVVEDLTERHALEEQLRQAQKMEAIGQLAGGVAHDFNNLLTTVLASSELLAADLPADTAHREDTEMIRAAAQRGADLTAKLLAFSRQQPLDRRPLSLGALLTDFTRMARRFLPENVMISLSADAPDAVVRADPVAVDQILMNLVTNARDAMPTGGTLSLRIARATLDDVTVRARGWGRPGDYAVLEVGDTGAGIAPETQRRIFEPFFTTKPLDQHTGLGMAVVYGLVKQHDGFVGVESEPGRGTAVRVYFPVAAEVAEARPAPDQGEITGGNELVLLVEDDASVRRSTKRVLERFGYVVVVSPDGHEALDYLRAQSRLPDLVISDVVMPRTSGPQMLERMRDAGWKTKVLFTSGYAARDMRDRATLDPGLPFLPKPWTVTELLRKVREVLDAPAGT